MVNIDKEVFFTMGDSNYMGLMELLVKSLNRFSDRKILVYGINCDVSFDSDNMIKKRIDFSSDGSDKVGVDSDPYKRKSFHPNIMFKKFDICVDIINSGYERIMYVDGDSFVTKNIDTIWKDFDVYADYPLLTKHCVESMFLDWRDKNGNLIKRQGEKGDELERPLMEEYFGKYEREGPYLQPCAFTFNKNCIGFFKQAIEVANFCFKNIKLYTPFYDETIFNVLIWQRNGKKHLPIVAFNTEGKYPYVNKQDIPKNWHGNVFKNDYNQYFNYFFMSNEDIKELTTSNLQIVIKEEHLYGNKTAGEDYEDIENIRDGFKLELFHYFPDDRNQTLMFHGNKCVAQGTRMYYDYCINVGELSQSSFSVTDIDFINRKIYFFKGTSKIDNVKLRVYAFIKKRDGNYYFTDDKIYLSENDFDLKDNDATSFFITYPKTDFDTEYISVSINDFINDECEYVYRKK